MLPFKKLFKLLPIVITHLASSLTKISSTLKLITDMTKMKHIILNHSIKANNSLIIRQSLGSTGRKKKTNPQLFDLLVSFGLRISYMHIT